MPNRPLLVITATALALVLSASPALAKGIESVTACGQNGCATTDDVDEQVIFGGGLATSPPSQGHEWYRVRLAMGHQGEVFERLRVDVVLKPGLIHSTDRLGGAEWTRMSPEQRAFYAELIGELEPLPATKLGGVEKPDPAAISTAPPEPPSASPADDGGFPWPIVLAGLAALAAATHVLRRPARSGSGPLAEPLRR